MNNLSHIAYRQYDIGTLKKVHTQLIKMTPRFSFVWTIIS